MYTVRADNIKAVIDYMGEEGTRAIKMMIADTYNIDADVTHINDVEHRYFKGNTLKCEISVTKQQLQMLRGKI